MTSRPVAPRVVALVSLALASGNAVAVGTPDGREVLQRSVEQPTGWTVASGELPRVA